MLNQTNKPYYDHKEIEEPMYDDTAIIVCPDKRIKYENKAAKPDANIIRVFTKRWIR